MHTANYMKTMERETSGTVIIGEKVESFRELGKIKGQITATGNRDLSLNISKNY